MVKKANQQKSGAITRLTTICIITTTTPSGGFFTLKTAKKHKLGLKDKPSFIFGLNSRFYNFCKQISKTTLTIVLSAVKTLRNVKSQQQTIYISWFFFISRKSPPRREFSVGFPFALFYLSALNILPFSLKSILKHSIGEGLCKHI